MYGIVQTRILITSPTGWTCRSDEPVFAKRGYVRRVYPSLAYACCRIRAIVRPYGIPLTYVDIPEVWLGTHPSMLSTVPDNSTAFTGTAVAFCRPQLSVNVCSLLKRVDWVGVNAHPFYAGVPATCDELNVTGCYNGASWVLGR